MSHFGRDMVWNFYHFCCHNGNISYLIAWFGETLMEPKALEQVIKPLCLTL